MGVKISVNLFCSKNNLMALSVKAWYFIAVEFNNIALPQTFSETEKLYEQGYEIAQWSGAVNFLFLDESIVLIKRSDSMPSHSGQIGFFGGHKKTDEQEPIQVAMREFEEESGLSRDLVVYEGILQPVMTARQQIIFPVLGRLQLSEQEFFTRVVSNGEWDNVILLSAASIQREELWSYGRMQNYPIYFFPLLPEFSRYWRSDNQNPYTLWGATAKMIWNFFKNVEASDKFSLR